MLLSFRPLLSILLLFILVISVVQGQNATKPAVSSSVSKSPASTSTPKSGNNTDPDLPPLAPPPPSDGIPPGGFDPDKLGLGAGNQLTVGFSLFLGLILSLAMMII